ncbi:hypothetical protein JCM15765_40130 [Paradesulfitobacterium aromaticivorans]
MHTPTFEIVERLPRGCAFHHFIVDTPVEARGFELRYNNQCVFKHADVPSRVRLILTKKISQFVWELTKFD